MYVCLLALAHQVTTNGLIFTIFRVFEAHASICHLPNDDDYNTDGFVVKKKLTTDFMFTKLHTLHYVLL